MVDYTNTSLHFKILRDISNEGKNSTIHLAHDYQLDTEIVVKKIKKADFTDPKTFFDEAKKLYSSNHPNIAPIQYSCQDDENIYITMPLFSKGSLNKIIDSRPLRPSEVIKYSLDFLSGVHHIHTKRLLHCDIKPTDILVSDSDDAILTDFGLAKFLAEDNTTTIEKFYNWHRAPETLQSNAISQQSDIFQAGLTIYRLCNGNRLFRQQLERFIVGGMFDADSYYDWIVKEKFPDRTLYLDHVPQRIRNYIRKALAADPASRYQSVLDLLNDLAGVDVPYDWQMTPKADGATWECIKDEKMYRVDISMVSQTECKIKTTKQVDGGSERKIKDYCSEKLDIKAGQKLVKDALSNSEL